VSVTGGDAEFVVGPLGTETDKFNARINVKIDEIAIGGRA